MDKLFNSYWALRVTALVLALLLFFYAKAQLDEGQTSASNPQMDIITDVPLEVYYDKENLIVSGIPETVDVTIEGPMQIVLKTKLAKDFKVFVDLNSLLIGEHRVTIQHENFSDKLDVTIDPKVLDIIIEEKVTEEVKVEPEFNSSLIADGYELVGMAADPTSVFVTGAKSIIESISYVKATVNSEEGITESFRKQANVKVLDNSLNKLDVTIEPESVEVGVDIRQYSRKVPISIKQTGTTKDGVTVNSLTTQTKSVEVFGPKSMIDPLTRLEVEFDISEIQESGEYEIDIPLPNGATKLAKNTIKVQANVTKAETKPESEATQVETPPTENTEPEVESNSGETTPEEEEQTTTAEEDNNNTE